MYEIDEKCRKCKNNGTAICNRCDMYYDEFDPIDEPKPMTNADRLRAMSDEEMAEWLEGIRLCCATDLCGRRCPFAEVCYSDAEAPKETLDWLRQEAQDG